jgi:hypothetical protein
MASSPMITPGWAMRVKPLIGLHRYTVITIIFKSRLKHITIDDLVHINNQQSPCKNKEWLV